MLSLQYRVRIAHEYNACRRPATSDRWCPCPFQPDDAAVHGVPIRHSRCRRPTRRDQCPRYSRLLPCHKPHKLGHRSRCDLLRRDWNPAIQGRLPLIHLYATGWPKSGSVFHLSVSVTAHPHTAGPETAPDREILVATLSGAIVAVMDGIGYVNKSRVMRSCRADGVVLKPDMPLAIADWCFKTSSSPPESCYIYTTHTDVIDYARLHYVYLDERRSFSFDMLDTPFDAPHAVYNWYTRDITLIDVRDDPQNLHAIRPGYENHSYLVVSPVINNWAFIGDPEKYAAGSSKRFLSVRATADRVFVEIDGVANEIVHACAASLTTKLPLLPLGFPKLCCATARFEMSLTLDISISKADCRDDAGLSHSSATGSFL